MLGSHRVGSEFEYGSVFQLTEVSLVQGSCAILFKGGRETLCRLVRKDQIAPLVVRHRDELIGLVESKGCATPLGR